MISHDVLNELFISMNDLLEFELEKDFINPEDRKLFASKDKVVGVIPKNKFIQDLFEVFIREKFISDIDERDLSREIEPTVVGYDEEKLTRIVNIFDWTPRDEIKIEVIDNGVLIVEDEYLKVVLPPITE